MKKLLIITLLTVSSVSFAATSSCDLNLEVKKDGAKTAYIAGTSVSSKIQDALKTVCKISYKVMSKSEINTMKLDNAKKRYEKLLAASGEKQ